jgi:DNA-binding transcriptional LysR family regulator
MKNATIRQLQIFSIAARHLSFVRAAEEICLTQPAVSMQIGQLEQTVGMPLFRKIGRKLQLTEAGREVEHTACKVLAALREAEDNIAALKGLRAGLVSVTLVSTAMYFIPRLISLFRKLHDHVEVQIAVSNRETLLQQLHHREIDLAVMDMPPENMGVLSFPFARHPHVLVASPNHRLSKCRRIPAAELNEERFVVREVGSGTRLVMENFFKAEKINPQRRIVMGNNETIKQAVIADLGISFVSLHTIGLEVKTGQLVVLDVENAPVMRTWYVVHLRDNRLSPATLAFKEFILKEAGPYLESTVPNTPVHSRREHAPERRLAMIARPPVDTPAVLPCRRYPGAQEAVRQEPVN